MSRNSIFAIFLLIILILIVFVSRGAYQSSKPYEVFNKERAKKVAAQWISNKSSTYIFDGTNLEIKKESANPCYSCYEFVFSFNSMYPGYGNRASSAWFEEITPHTIVVKVERGIVVEVVTDGIYDEMEGGFLIQSGE